MSQVSLLCLFILHGMIVCNGIVHYNNERSVKEKISIHDHLTQNFQS